MGLISKICVMVVTILTATSVLAGEFLTLELGDQLLRSRRGDDTLRLKRLINQQHPGMNVRELDIMSVVLVAKSARGNATAELVVGRNVVDSDVIDGNRQDFRDHDEETFDRIILVNKSASSGGKWQIKVRGRVIAHQAVVEVVEPTVKANLLYHDLHLRAGRGTGRGNDTIRLKADLRSQLGLRPADYEIVKVVVKAKSKNGGGSVALKVGQQMSAPANLSGVASDFHNDAVRTYDTDTLLNPSASSQGAWQLKFKGNVKVKSVKVILKSKF